jgi:3-oxoacyl-[acyl-carrier-protein] synthase II
VSEAIVITGCGPIAPNGIGVEAFWPNIVAGTSGISRIESIDTTALPNKFGGELKNFRIEDFDDGATAKAMGRGSQLSLAAATLAMRDAGLTPRELQQANAGIYIGTTMGESPIAEGLRDHMHAGGTHSTYAGRMRYYPVNMMTSMVAMHLGLTGPSSVIPTACAAGNYAIGYACDALRSGRSDYMLAGGVDPWSRIAYYGFNAMMAISPDVCRPFDRNRKGILISEGAGMLLLERESQARRRGARIYAELAGCGIAADGHHMTGPHPEGRGGILAGRRAMQRACIDPGEIDYVSAHGTGTAANDRIETHIITTLLGARASKVPVSSVKSMLGHTMGAASALETIVCARAIETGVVPPTINYETPDPACPLDVVPNQPREVRVRVAMNNSFAFGGNCATLLLRHYHGN